MEKIKDKLTAQALLIKDKKFSLRDVSESLQDDKDFVLSFLAVKPHELKFASLRLRADKDLITEAIKNSAFVFEHANPTLKDNADFVKEMIQINHLIFLYANPRLRADKDFVLPIIKKNGNLLGCLSKELKKDKEIVKEAILSQGYIALDSADKDLRQDKSFIEEMIVLAPQIMSYTYEPVLTDMEMWAKALKIEAEQLQYSSATNIKSKVFDSMPFELKQSFESVGDFLKYVESKKLAQTLEKNLNIKDNNKKLKI